MTLVANPENTYQEVKTEKQRQGNEVEDFNSLSPSSYMPPVANQQQEEPEQLIQSWYTPPPKPTFNTEAPEYMKRTAKNNAISEGFSAIADILALANGGNVGTPQKDNLTPAYINNYFGYLDRNIARADNYNLQAWNHKNRQADMILNSLYRKEDNAYRNKVFGANQSWKELDFAADQAYKRWQQEQKLQDNAESRRRWETEMDWKQKIPYINASLDEQKANNDMNRDLMKYQYKMRGDKKLFVLYDDYGREVTALDDGMKNKVLATIMQDPAAKKEFDALKTQFGDNLSVQHKDYLVAKYWNQSPAVMSLINSVQRGGPLETGTQSGIPGVDYSTPDSSPMEQRQAPASKSNSSFNYSDLNY